MNIKITVIFHPQYVDAMYVTSYLYERPFIQVYVPDNDVTLHPSPTLSQLPVVLPGAGSPPK